MKKTKIDKDTLEIENVEVTTITREKLIEAKAHHEICIEEIDDDLKILDEQ